MSGLISRISPHRPRAAWLLSFSLSLLSVVAHATKFEWTPPTTTELVMTSDSKAPDAPAVILSYDESDNGDNGELVIHVRIKVLKEAGRKVGDFGRLDGDFQARTIHPDGTVIPLVIAPPKRIFGIFPGKVEPALATALPDVTVGSIVEYFFSSSSHFGSPDWTLQHEYFIHSAHFSLKPPGFLDATDTRWIAHLPPGAAITRAKKRVNLDLTDIPPAPDEDFMPPATSAVYNVRFFYYTKPSSVFWGAQAEVHRDGWERFCEPDKSFKAVAQSLVQPGDSDLVKLRKLYAAVQALENTDLSRERTLREVQRPGFAYAENVGQVWTRRRGNSYQLTLLFIALARSAGFEANPMSIASRDHAVFDIEVLDWRQLDSLIAIVLADKKEIFFDPGIPRCPFGHLAPWHASVTGLTIYQQKLLSQTTPYDSAQGSRVDRLADLAIDPTGSVSGNLRITFSGTAAIPLRISAILQDEQFVRSELEKNIQKSLPEGVQVKLQSLDGLSDGEVPLLAKRLLIPAQFFASTDKPLFVSATRATPVAFPGRYATRDQMNLTLSPGLVPETLPKGESIFIAQASNYDTRLKPPPEGGHVLVTQRLFSLNRLDYEAKEYTSLHDFFSRIASTDQEQIVLLTSPPTSAATN